MNRNSSNSNSTTPEDTGATFESVDIRDAIPWFTNSGYGAELRASANEAFARMLAAGRDRIFDSDTAAPGDEGLNAFFDFAAASSDTEPANTTPSSGIPVADCTSNTTGLHHFKQPNSGQGLGSTTATTDPFDPFFSSEVRSAVGLFPESEIPSGTLVHNRMPSQQVIRVGGGEVARGSDSPPLPLGGAVEEEINEFPAGVQQQINQHLRATTARRQMPSGARKMSETSGITKMSKSKKTTLAPVPSVSDSSTTSGRSADWTKEEDWTLYNAVQTWNGRAPALPKSESDSQHKWAFVSKAFDNCNNERGPASCADRMSRIMLGGKIVTGTGIRRASSWTEADDTLHRDLRLAGNNDEQVVEAMGGKFTATNVRRRWAVVMSARYLWPSEHKTYVSGGAEVDDAGEAEDGGL